MRIVSMEIFPIRLTLKDPIPMSSGVIESTGNVVVELISDEGVSGWGEGVEAPTLTGHRQADVVADLESLRGVVVGSDPRRVTELWARARSARPAASTALGALDIAVHDLVGKRFGMPVHAMLGGAVRDRVPALTLVGSGNREEDARKLKTRAEAGYSWFKIKLGMATREVEWATIAAAIDLAGEAGVVCGDANEAWNEEDALGFLAGLQGMPVRFIEQPVSRDDDAMLLRVAESSPIPICADESAGNLASVLRLVGTSIGGVSLKLIKHGGITGVMRGAGICAEAGLGVNLAGKVIESSVSAAANLHCAAAMQAIDFGCSPANQGLVSDVTHNPITLDAGEFTVPTAPGLGVDVDKELLRRLAG